MQENMCGSLHRFESMIWESIGHDSKGYIIEDSFYQLIDERMGLRLDTTRTKFLDSILSTYDWIFPRFARCNAPIMARLHYDDIIYLILALMVLIDLFDIFNCCCRALIIVADDLKWKQYQEF